MNLNKPRSFDMKQGATIRSKDLAGASVIQQLGLDTPDGLQRLCQMLVDKLDPESKGVVLTIADMQHYVHKATVENRSSMMVRGANDQIILRLVTPEEMQAAEAYEADQNKGTPQ